MKRTQLFSATATVLFVATTAQAQHAQDDRRGRQDQHASASSQDQQHRSSDEHRRIVESRPAGTIETRAEQTRESEARAAEAQNQRRSGEQDERQRYLQTRQRQQQEQLERTQRIEQEERIAQEQRRAEAIRAYDRDRDYRSGYDYRYNMAGVYRETNQYGVDVLRQAVNQGYQQGYRAGQIDRRDGAPADYRRALDFQSGEYRYTGTYVPSSDYGYYFGEGFQRGYDDAYWNRARYGTFSNGNGSILSDIVSGILGLTLLR